MDENENRGVAAPEAETAETAGEAIQESEGNQGGAETAETPAAEETDHAERFTRDQVNELIRARIERERARTMQRLGIESLDELEAISERARDAEAGKAEMERIKEESKGLRAEIAFLRNGVDEARRDDVQTYFRGKGLEMTDESVAEAIATHPEWKARFEETPRATVVPLGAAQTEKAQEDEEAAAARMFGLKRGFVGR